MRGMFQAEQRLGVVGLRNDYRKLRSIESTIARGARGGSGNWDYSGESNAAIDTALAQELRQPSRTGDAAHAVEEAERRSVASGSITGSGANSPYDRGCEDGYESDGASGAVSPMFCLPPNSNGGASSSSFTSPTQLPPGSNRARLKQGGSGCIPSAAALQRQREVEENESANEQEGGVGYSQRTQLCYQYGAGENADQVAFKLAPPVLPFRAGALILETLEASAYHYLEEPFTASERTYDTASSDVMAHDFRAFQLDTQVMTLLQSFPYNAVFERYCEMRARHVVRATLL